MKSMKKIVLACCVLLGIFALSCITPADVDAAVSKFKTRVSPLGKHVVNREHHYGSVKLRAAGCAGVAMGVPLAAPRAACSGPVNVRRTAVRVRASAFGARVGVRSAGVCGACGGMCGVAGCTCGCQN